MYQLISYFIQKNSPSWPGNPTLDMTVHSSIQNGDVANTCTIHLFNHYGTHFDAPLHFYEKGLPIASLPLETFLYQSPILLDLPKEAGEKIEPEDLMPYFSQIESCDLLMLRTSFGKNRVTNPSVYENNGPAISSRTAKYLVETFINLKAIALDFISLASYSDQTDGNLAHQYMLGKFQEKYICIIEDVNLGIITADKIKHAAAVPLMIEGIDSCPVTMWIEQ